MWGAKGPLSDNWLVDNQGYLQKDVAAASIDGTMTINITQGTKILDSAGNPLANITVSPVAPPAAAPDGYQLLKSFDFNPDGAKFNPGISITISFNESDVPAGKTVALAFYNESEDKWEFVSGTDNGNGTATFELTHFSAYTLLYEKKYPSSFVDSIPLVGDLSTNPKVIGTNLLFALLLVLMFYIAATLFNSALRENYAAIEGWMARPFKRLAKPKGDSEDPARKNNTGKLLLEGFLAVLVTALLYCFLDPYFTHGMSGLLLFAAMTIAIGIVTFFYEGVQILLSKYRFGVPAKFKLHPIALVLGLVFVLISRAVHFHPGLIFGFVGACVPLLATRHLDTRKHGILILVSTVTLTIACILTFLLRTPLHDAMAGHESVGWSLLDMILAAIFIIGLEGLVFTLIPLMFVDGERLVKWHKWIWITVFTIVVFLFYYIIINKDGEIVDAMGDIKVQMMFVITGVFLVLSIGVWLFLGMRHKRKAESGHAAAQE